MTFILLFLIVISSVAMLLFGVMVWARFWPRVTCVIEELHAKPVNFGQRDLYATVVSYSYERNGITHRSKNMFLFGGRAFPSEREALEHFSVNCAYVCPLNDSWVFLRQDPRVFWGLFAASVFGFILSYIIFLLE